MMPVPVTAKTSAILATYKTFFLNIFYLYRYRYCIYFYLLLNHSVSSHTWSFVLCYRYPGTGYPKPDQQSTGTCNSFSEAVVMRSSISDDKTSNDRFGLEIFTFPLPWRYTTVLEFNFTPKIPVPKIKITGFGNTGTKNRVHFDRGNTDNRFEILLKNQKGEKGTCIEWKSLERFHPGRITFESLGRFFGFWYRCRRNI